MLWLLTSIKMIEVRNNLNNKNIILLLFLCIGTSSLFNIGFISNLIHIFSLILLINSLLVLNKYKSENIFKQLLILISFLPLTLISFINIPSPKPWLRQNFKTTAKTGLNDELRPGDINSLAQNGELVARVFFSDQLPKPENRYWRVYVLDRFKNNTWTSTSKFNKQNIIQKNIVEENFNREMLKSERWILEPNYIMQRPWSGKGNSKSENLSITKKGVLLGSKKLNKRDQYEIIHEKNAWREIAPQKISLNSEIKNKLLFQLSKKWLNESSTPEEILGKSREWFLKGGFTYSINPGNMSKKSPYDDFLFQKKRGFCEHFAASFALLMRYANIPARVVIGFQGGEIFKDAKNKNYLLIDNTYAHAWNEIWIENKGWIRVDPTSWVFPERIKASTLLINKDESRLRKFAKNINLKYIFNLTRIEQDINYIAEIINRRFKIIKFSENLVFNRLISILFFAFLLFLTIISLLLLENKKKIGLLRLNLNIYLSLLKTFSITKKKGETLKSFCLRVLDSYPHLEKEIKEIYIIYNSYKFSNDKFSTQKLIILFLKMSFYQTKILTFIALKKAYSNISKFRLREK
ncbi:transglutaminase-like [Prochlorococcus marinus str. GP2]|uniref:Transglutaminase-like n=1 Tax=Prochlorococcus marinus str. GP2 TaxID=59925 RepID=A0A0A1ZDL4_PROMR|nr:transglutaminase-like [Prochlorococcus marinus str. GP2]